MAKQIHKLFNFVYFFTRYDMFYVLLDPSDLSILKMGRALSKYIEKASKRKQIEKQKKKSWRENGTNNKFYEKT